MTHIYSMVFHGIHPQWYDIHCMRNSESFTAHCACHPEVLMWSLLHSCTMYIQPPVLRETLDACVDYLDTSTSQLDLHGGDISHNIQSECPTSQCLPHSSFTYTQNDSFLEFSVAQQSTDYIRISLQLQTRWVNGHYINHIQSSISIVHTLAMCFNSTW